jgi:hypothetical protein
MAADRLLRNVIHEDGGPLLHNGSEEEQRSPESTRRKFHRFLTQSQRRARQLPTDSPDEANIRRLFRWPMSWTRT